MNGHVITVMVTSDNGLHVAGYSIYPPYDTKYKWDVTQNDTARHIMTWDVYLNDGSGNGDFLMAFDSFSNAMNYVATKAQGFVDPDYLS